ncbi:MAG: RNA-directed DNA polymerase [Pseudobdellovibrionaceae bacterium]
MPEIFKHNVSRAVRNVISHGDTDVLPYSFENILIRKNPEEFVKLVENLAEDFKNKLEDSSPQFESTLVPAGYNGYRWVTQIDPFWNSYLLSAIIRHGKDIEGARLPSEDKSVHSYRFNPDKDSDSLFLPDWGWHSFMRESFERAQNKSFVVVTDISEFYRRIYHHRIQNALERVCSTNIPINILKLLSKFSLGTSYGVPVGGPAARVIAELVLDQIDHLLRARGISFCRFVDDYHIFADSEQEAYRAIQQLSELLILNQGLSLQKSKTRIMSCQEFVITFPTHLKPDAKPMNDRERLFSLSLNYDPYSSTAEEDYEALKNSLDSIDFLSLLNEELNKSQTHGPTISKLIKALRVTKGKVREQAIITLMDNVHLLYPVFSQLLIVLYYLKGDFSDKEKEAVINKLLSLISEGSYLMALDAHKCYAIKIIADSNDYIVDSIFTNWLVNGSDLLKRDVIIGFIARGGWNHLSDYKNRVSGQTPWVKRAMLSASYGLGDEGKHWRQAQNFSEFEKFTKKAMENCNPQELI